MGYRWSRKKSLSVIPQLTTALASLWASSSSGWPVHNQTDELVKTKAAPNKGCDVCQNFEYRGNSITSKRLTKSLHTCRTGICLVFARVVEPYDFFQCDENTIHTWDLEKFRFHVNLNIRGRVINLSVYRSALWSDHCPWPEIRPFPHFRSMGNRAVTYQISSWLEECDLKHDSCNAAKEDQVLPTRVLHILGPQEVRLLDTWSIPSARYACLSYCWGKTMPFRTTKSNISTLQKGIDWKELPKTFQDAVDVTRTLGLQYIWIDSLCIIQDDIIDWRHEGTKMASIYAHSYVTLAATMHPNAYGGLYTETSPASKMSPLTILDGYDRPIVLYVQEDLDHDDFYTESYPLMKRAWVFQERLLSPRTIHFTDQELYFECRAKQTCECGPPIGGDTLPLLTLQEEFALLFDSKTVAGDSTSINHPHEQSKQSNERSVQKLWRRIVTEYSKLSLTHDTDIFPALQGVAKQMQCTRTGSYYAGIWEDNFLEDLYWRYDYPVSTLCNDYRAPTWSWAAQKGLVKWPVIDRFWLPDYAASVISISTKPKGTDMTGELESGSLVLKGYAFRLQSVIQKTTEGVTEIVYESRGRFAGKQMAAHDRPNFFFDVEAKVKRKERKKENGTAVAELLVLKLLEDVYKYSERMYCILLEDVPHPWQSTGVYKRVGIASIGKDWYLRSRLESSEMTVTII